MSKSKLLFDEPPIVVSPSLACLIGLHEAMILQQIHYWLYKSGNTIDGKKWVYNSYKDWQKQFPFWSIATIKRTIKSLKKQDLIETGNYNKLKVDRTVWYTINYDKLESMSICDPSIGSTCTDHSINLTPPIPETTTENTSETTTEKEKKSKEKTHTHKQYLNLNNLGIEAKNVFITKDEFNKLVEKVGDIGAQKCIEKLSIYKGANGKKYKSDYLAILNWVIDWYQKQGSGLSEHTKQVLAAGDEWLRQRRAKNDK